MSGTARRHPSALAGTGAAHAPSYPKPRKATPSVPHTVDPASGYITLDVPVRPAAEIIAEAMRNLGYGVDKPARSAPIPKTRGGDE